ncbi:MAG TPA: twin-arginine translocase TatA/TatE family subunit [Stellaceae bacterium]|nr:twin-arginine translocase TatA/TatE family subunit [Stellaceae bacterium]
MDFFSLPHLLLILVIVVLLFGAGKLPRVMGDFAKGIKAFKAGMKEETEPEQPPAQVSPPGGATSTASTTAADHTREHA